MSLFRFLPSKYKIAYLKLKKRLKVENFHQIAEAKEVYDILAWRLRGMHNCLCRSFVTYLIFLNYLPDIKFHYGVELVENSLSAHSWVEDSAGQPLSDKVSLNTKFKSIMSF